MRIRVPDRRELPVLQDIERAAGRWFRDIDMPEIAEDDPPSVDKLASYQLAGRAWVVADPADAPIGYLIADVVDGNLHVAQLSVHPDHARRGLGRRLLDHLVDQAALGGIPALTLTTFAHVPWNAPYYLRCGFRVLADRELTAGLREIRQREIAHGMDRWPRVCMRREVWARRETPGPP
ncbi:MAG: GNAT family N-acetyltransferase [Dactylosporangium sp.]|nr:GNAT family N-acetyltransferase [Dactylosporangium sp.]NNJ61205.1 GNAT family N-acetyltransferase [Dactylosporangium sp.]